MMACPLLVGHLISKSFSLEKYDRMRCLHELNAQICTIFYMRAPRFLAVVIPTATNFLKIVGKSWCALPFVVRVAASEPLLFLLAGFFVSC